MPNALQKRASDMQSFIAQRKDALSQMMPNKSSVERFMRIVVSAVTKDPKLLNCDPVSIYTSMSACAQLGLEPLMGRVYFVPFGKTCTMMIGYQGLVDLVRRSGEVDDITAHVVYENDKFEIQYGCDETVIHTPTVHGPRGKPLGAYAVGWLKTGAKKVEWMNYEDIEEIRKGSQGKNAGPWKDHWGEMARKTVVRRIVKLLPVCIEAQQAIQIEDDRENGLETSAGLKEDPEVLIIQAEQEGEDKRAATTKAMGKAEQRQAPKPKPTPPPVEEEAPPEEETPFEPEEETPPPPPPPPAKEKTVPGCPEAACDDYADLYALGADKATRKNLKLALASKGIGRIAEIDIMDEETCCVVMVEYRKIVDSQKG